MRIEDKRRTKEYDFLEKMIDELYDAGVDTSYFPEKAEDVLLKYSEKIEIK